MRHPTNFLAAIALLLPLAACGQPQETAPEPQTITLEETGPRQAVAYPSPDTTRAVWSVAETGQAVHFGNAGDAPLLTLACDLEASPPGFVIIRHAEAFPNQSALFPFVGNGMRSRFLADTKLVDGEWRWEASLPASHPMLDIFEGTRDLTATLPGRGMLAIGGSRIPGEFVEWCRAGGRTPELAPNDDAGITAED